MWVGSTGGGPSPQSDRRVCIALWVELDLGEPVARCTYCCVANLRGAANQCLPMVRDLGLAVELKLDYRRGGDQLVTAEEIEKAVKCVMDGESEVRKRVKEMSEKSKKAMVNGGSSFASLEQLIENMLENYVVPSK
ncbi:hypothetical protein SLA2020_276080 [Shorea laevis]